MSRTRCAKAPFYARVVYGCLALLLLATAAAPTEPLASGSAATNDWGEDGDAAFSRRAENSPGPGLARSAPIDAAIALYEQELAAQPNDLERRIRLLRAIFFKGEYVPGDQTSRRLLFERGRDVFEQGRAQLAEPIGGTATLDRLSVEQAAQRLAKIEHAGALYFWGAVHWGLWGQYFGTMASIRKGVAKRIRRLGEMARALDPETDQGGPHRLLGRLNTIAPKVVFFTGWIDRDYGVELLAQAVETAPSDPLNRFFFAEGLLDHRGTTESQRTALDLLCQLSTESPRDRRLIEDQKALAQARERLELEQKRLPNACQ